MDLLLIPGLAAVALLVAAVLLRGRRAIFWFAFLLPFVPIEYIDRYHVRLPSALKWSPLLGIALAAGAALVLLPQVRTRIPRRVLGSLAALMALGLVSMLANGTAPAAFLVAQRGWVVAVAAMIALKAAYGIYDRDRLHRFLVTIGLVSCVVSVLQRFVVVPRVGGMDAADRVTGLFSVGYQQLFFHLFCFGIVLSYDLRGRRVVPLPSPAVLGMFLLSLAVGNEKASLPYLLALSLFVLWRTGFRDSIRRAGKPLLAALVMPAVLLVGYSAVNDARDGSADGRSYIARMTDGEYLRRYFFGDGSTRLTSGGELLRGAAVQFVWAELADDPVQVALGLGPGETAESRLPGASGGLASRYPGYGINRISFAMVLGDGGLGGLLLYALVLASIWRARPASRPPEHDRIRELLVFLAVGFSFYANLTNEAVYCLALAVVLYPDAEGRA